MAPITSIAANIGGDRVDVEGIVPEGTNSHTFEPAPQVAELLSTADVVLINGLQLEEPTKDLAESNMKDDAVLVELGDEVLPEEDYIFDFSFPEEDGKPNPHLWTDPTYADRVRRGHRRDVQRSRTRTTPTTTRRTSRRSPRRRMHWRTPCAPTRSRCRTATSSWSPTTTPTPTSPRPSAGTSSGRSSRRTSRTRRPHEVALLIDQVEAEGVTTIFGSEVFPSAVLEEIGRATGVRYEDTLRDDDLPGEPGEADHSWLGLMRYNYETMIEGLGGTAEQLPAVDTEDVAPDEAEYPQ